MGRTDRRARRRLIAALAAGFIIAILLAVLPRSEIVRAPGGAPADESGAGGVVAEVIRVYDGDTIEVRGVGKVRLIGIDALDGYNQDRMTAQALQYGMPPATVRQWADRATEFARRMLAGRSVRLQYGPELTDDYGRTLAYVHVGVAGGRTPADGAGEQDFNLAMLRKGLAAAYRAARHPRRDEYLAAEARARTAHLGLWHDANAKP